MYGRLTFIAALMAAPLAWAQEPVSASVESLAAASAEADALIAGTGSPELFVNVSSDGMAKVRHRASGLVCTFMPGAANNTLMLFDGGSLPRGDDVGCNADFGALYLTYYATRYGEGYSALDSVREAAAAVRNRFPDARPYDNASIRISPPDGVGEPEFAAFLIGPEASRRYTHAASVKVGEWIFKQRMTADGAEGAIMANQLMSAVFFNDVLEAAVGPDKP